MRLISDIRDMQTFSKQRRNEGKTLGFVPTMGALHAGHVALIEAAAGENDIVIASVFVNPTQFGPDEDYESYPRDLTRDQELAAGAGTDVLFVPDVESMYPDGYATYVTVEGITERLCGARRPGHFRGVTTVVTKLLNITKPHRAYFGQKDYQQLRVIRRMVEDMNMDVVIEMVSTRREQDGLAISSRNAYLNEEERRSAPVLYRALSAARRAIECGETDADKLRDLMKSTIASDPLARIDYLSVSDPDTLEELDSVQGKALLAGAIWIGKARLIDNILIGQGDESLP